MRQERHKGILLSPETQLPEGKNGEQASFYLTDNKPVEGFGHIKQVPNGHNGNIIDGYEVTFFDTDPEQVVFVDRDDLSPFRPPDEGMAGANFLSELWAKEAINLAIEQALDPSAQQ
jgi:hypothetical protein